jgi:hypothetical protein
VYHGRGLCVCLARATPHWESQGYSNIRAASEHRDERQLTLVDTRIGGGLGMRLTPFFLSERVIKGPKASGPEPALGFRKKTRIVPKSLVSHVDMSR